jgi:hypothetical protein
MFVDRSDFDTLQKRRGSKWDRFRDPLAELDSRESQSQRNLMLVNSLPLFTNLEVLCFPSGRVVLAARTCRDNCWFAATDCSMPKRKV